METEREIVYRNKRIKCISSSRGEWRKGVRIPRRANTHTCVTLIQVEGKRKHELKERKTIKRMKSKRADKSTYKWELMGCCLERPLSAEGTWQSSQIKLCFHCHRTRCNDIFLQVYRLRTHTHTQPAVRRSIAGSFIRCRWTGLVERNPWRQDDYFWTPYQSAFSPWRLQY